jgi:phage tail-like protein
MNVNGSRFELLLGRADWGRCRDGDGESARTLESWWDGALTSPPTALAPALPAWDGQRHEISIQPLAIALPATPTEAPLDLEARRPACADRHGNVYRIGDDRRSLAIRAAADRRESVFWPALPEDCEDERRRARLDFTPVDPVEAVRRDTYLALAVTADDYLVVAFTRGAARGFLSFDLMAGGPPVETSWPATPALEVFDMAPRQGGGVWVLDRTNRQLWELDCRLAVVRTAQPAVTLIPETLDDFQPLSGAPRERPAVVFPGGIDLNGGAASVVDPIAIELDGDGAVLLLDIDAAANRSRVVRLRRSGGAGWRPDQSRWIDELPDLAHDFVIATALHYQNEQPERQLFIVTRSGNQASAFRMVDEPDAFTLTGTTELFPLRRFGGRALLAIKDRAYYDSGITVLVWTPIVQQPRMLFGKSAALVTPIFDSTEIGTTWDRVLVDGCIPPDTAIEIMSRAGDERADLADGAGSPGVEAPQLMGAWLPEPFPYLRAGSELPWLRGEAARSTKRERGVGTWELLLQHAHGRYLQLRIVLTSANGMATPRLRALRVWSPRFSYPHRFLPAVYREDTTAGAFLERWLANMESTLTGIEDRVVNLQALFDARIAPAGVLAWLASWFEIAFDPEWDEPRRRLFVKRAMDFFRWRGTAHGLRLSLELAFNACIDESMFDGPSPEAPAAGHIRIVETYQTRLIGSIAAGDPGGQEPGPRAVRLEKLWTPAEGNAGLAARYAALVGREPTFVEQVTPFPLVRPAGDEQTTWMELVQSALGFVPSIGAAEQARWRAFLLSRSTAGANAALPRDLPASEVDRAAWLAFNATTDGRLTRSRWHDFLARRYRRIERLNRAWETTWPAFDVVALPDVLPHTEAAQTDWLQFERHVLAMHRTAHRFSVLLPIGNVTADPFALEQRLALARRIVDLEKPAHTVFDVRYYWAFFRVGEARLGMDTQLGAGSRAPELIPEAVLGRAFIGASFVGGASRPDDGDRLLVAH